MTTSHRGKIFLSFCVAILVLCAVAVSVYANFAKMNNQKRWVEHTYTVLSNLQELLSNMKDIQSAQRGYVITGMEEYLAPYHTAVPKIDDQLRDLTASMKDNPEQLESLLRLKDHINKRMDAAANVIDTYKTKGQKAAMDLVKQGHGKREMDEIRTITAEMTSRERELLTARRSSVDDYFKITMYAGISGTFMFVAILSAVFITMSREADQRLLTEEELRKAVAEMERGSHEALVIGKMGDYLRSCRDEEEAYEMISTNLPLIFPHSYGSIAIFSNSRNILRPVLTWGAVPDDVTLEFEPEDCWALRQGRAHPNGGDNSTPTCAHLEKLSKDNMTICLPMQAQGETIGQIFIGASKKERQPATRGEMGTMRRVTEQISLALANLNLQKALKEQSIKDPLTKLYNRRYLEDALTREIARAQRNGQSLTVLLMDIDHFKKINDTYGHDAGDAVLAAFAKMLTTKSRKADIACRWGGEEFILVLGNADKEFAASRAQEVCDTARALKISFQGKQIPVTVSIGAAVFPDHGEAPEDLIRHADLSLYRAKQGGRDRVVLYDPSFNS